MYESEVSQEVKNVEVLFCGVDILCNMWTVEMCIVYEASGMVYMYGGSQYMYTVSMMGHNVYGTYDGLPVPPVEGPTQTAPLGGRS